MKDDIISDLVFDNEVGMLNPPINSAESSRRRRYVMGRVQMKDYIQSGLILSGYSDDIVYVEGDLNAEFYPGNLITEDSKCECLYIAFSDGTLIGFCYEEDGIWRFSVEYQGVLYAEKIVGSIETDTNDIITFKPGIKWCLLGSTLSRTSS
jgi:hypothetical protein